MFKIALIGLTLLSGIAFTQESKDSQESGSAQPKAQTFSLGISDVKISLEDSTESTIKSLSLKQPNKIEKGFLAEKGQILKFHFFVNKQDQAGNIEAAANLDMAALIMNHTETGTVTYAPFASSKKGSYRLNLGKKNFPKFIQARSWKL
ncbi:hypothetical protein DSO57_1026344 [Entomophthora muscae]|uniref:Uncharacterized protein n=1 Tax=Entomophthora muscae TaxID=34485 RepID=A0ACC2S3R4_9FUNG|nr:hypothetical protein DSO57_1026344 [Entomophthora muscae]